MNDILIKTMAVMPAVEAATATIGHPDRTATMLTASSSSGAVPICAAATVCTVTPSVAFWNKVSDFSTDLK